MARKIGVSYAREDIDAWLKSPDGFPRKAALLVSSRLFELESMGEPHQAVTGKMAVETLDLYVPLANWLRFGKLPINLSAAT